MITWMQRHRKYLVVTIWISTIAFIGAGFVGWGQYNYGAKSGAIAEVGEISITQREWQQAYRRLFGQYSQMFEGDFDEEQAKKLGLDKQALRQLVNEALLMNLANSYNLQATDREVAEIVQSQDAFFENGVFSKALYHKVLKQNRLTSVEYEDDLRKSILIQKVLRLFEPEVNAIEEEAFRTAIGIADRIEYKILDESMVSFDRSDAALKAFWEGRRTEYMTPKRYKIEYVTQPVVTVMADDAALREYYDAHRHDFKAPHGKLLDFKSARQAVQAALDLKEANKEALRTYIDYKKGQLDEEMPRVKATVSASSERFSKETLDGIAGLSPIQPYLKPKQEGNSFVIVKLLETVPPQPKSFDAARDEVFADYRQAEISRLLIAQAKNEIDTFTGKTTQGYLTRQSLTGFEGLGPEETQELLGAIFQNNAARGMAGLKTHKMVLYHIVDQKIEAGSENDISQAVGQTKTALMNSGLIKRLDERYKTNIFVEGFAQ